MNKQVDFNLYEHIPNNFFNFITGENKILNSKIIFRVFLKAKNNNTYTLKKDDMLDIIEDYFNEFFFNESLEENGQVYTSSRDKATLIYRRLKECGWIDDDYDIDQTIVVNFEDYTIAILNTLLEIDKTNSFELSSKVYNIYSSLKNLEIDRAYLILSTIYENSKDLIDKLRALNSNIKKYIKRIVKLENKNDNEYLKTLLNELTGEYKENIIDKAYYYIKTVDNPRRYKKDFINYLDNLDENKQKIINQIKENDNVTDVLAHQKYKEIIDYLYDVFDECIYLMNEIDKKNETYIATCISKINIILNDNKDIEGLLINILKKSTDILEVPFIERKKLTEESIYKSRQRREKIENSIVIENTKIKDKDLAKSFLKDKTKYGRKKIYKYVTDKLEQKPILEIKDFNLEDNEELIKMILAIVYSKDEDCTYIIKTYDEQASNKGYKMKKFEIRRK